MDIEDFFTLEKENEGRILELVSPGGKKTEEWVRVRGSESDEFKANEHQSNKSLAKLAADKTLTDEQKTAQLGMISIRLVSSLIIEWSFDLECSKDNIVKLLTQAPRLKRDIDTFACNGVVFFSSKEKPSEAKSD